jgi:hypothetical protein
MRRSRQHGTHDRVERKKNENMFTEKPVGPAACPWPWEALAMEVGMTGFIRS